MFGDGLRADSAGWQRVYSYCDRVPEIFFRWRGGEPRFIPGRGSILGEPAGDGCSLLNSRRIEEPSELGLACSASLPIRSPCLVFRNRNKQMPDSRSNETVARPTVCPFCKGRIIDTLAKVITVNTTWRCRECDGTWTIAGVRQP